MPVIQAKSAGFCYGVRRAVELAEKTARENGGCVMLGSIIHNANVVAQLERLGARQADTPDQVCPGDTVIIRSHGETKQVLERLEDGPWRLRFRLLPYRAVGVERGLLLALRMDRVQVGEEDRGPMLAALSPTPVSDGGAYRVLVGAE